MKILKDNMELLLAKSKYIKRKEHEDKELNVYLNYWFFLEENEREVQILTNELLDVILYSKYYWSSRYKVRYFELYGIDVSVEQQQYKLIEELEQRVGGERDWNLIKSIDEGNI